MRILGIDPGREKTGWCILENYKLILYGVIDTRKYVYEGSFDLIISKLGSIYYLQHVSEIACERAFKSPKLNTAALQVVVQCIKEWGRRGELLLSLYSSTEWKRSLTGDAHADKDEVARCVRIHHPELTEDTSEHIFSSIGIALHHQGIRQLESKEVK